MFRRMFVRLSGKSLLSPPAYLYHYFNYDRMTGVKMLCFVGYIVIVTDNSMRINKWKMAIALIFGLCAFCVIFFRMYVPIVGTYIIMDPSESFVTLGAALTSLPGVFFITLMIGIASYLHLPVAMAAASIISHLVGALFIGLFARFIKRRSIHFFQQFILWLLGIALYYYLFIIFLFNLINYFTNYDSYIQSFGGETGFWNLYGIIAEAAFPEVLLTMFITIAVLFFLPPKYRKEHV